MKLAISAFALASLASSALAGGGGGYGNGKKCLSQSQAETLVNEYSAIIAQQPSDLGGPVRTARAIIAPGYTETSDSANMQLGIPLGAVTVPSKQVFIQSSQSNPPVDFDTIDILVAECNKIVWQWIQMDFGSGQYQVKGFHLFYVSGGQLSQTFFEFNSLAGALDTGYTVFYPNGTQFE